MLSIIDMIHFFYLNTDFKCSTPPPLSSSSLLNPLHTLFPLYLSSAAFSRIRKEHSEDREK